MIIDCHTHIFPDKIAPKVLSSNESYLGLSYYGSGTTSGLIEYMNEAGIDYAVAFGVAPEAKLVKATNDWLISQANPRLVLFGTITPDYENWESEIDRIKAAGIIGIKFNTLFQDILPDDRVMYPIYEKLKQEGMLVYFHAGKGGTQKERHQVRATPERLQRMIKDHPGLELICAHFGGYEMLEDVEQYLVGTKVYLDTSYTPSCKELDPVIVTRLIKKHGVERMLYGTDYPWARQGKENGWEYEFLNALDISEAQKELILNGNARRLFKL
jgi:predicted TIM-barrel fold metal-dependent hydrolase